MTIIEPKKNKFQLNIQWTIAIGLIVVEAVVSIVSYSTNVRLAHDVRDTMKSIEALRISTSDLRNQLYAKLDLQNVDELAGTLGLVKARVPEYLSAR